MPILRIIKSQTNIKFMKIKKFTLFISFILFLFSSILVLFKGLNLGIDFTGGTLIEARFKENINLNTLRTDMNKLDLSCYKHENDFYLFVLFFYKKFQLP